MPRRVKDFKLEFYNPSTGALRTTLTTNVRRIEILEAARDRADDAGFDILHDFADLSGIPVGDEVRVYVQTESDGALVHVWTGVLDDYEPLRHGPNFAELPAKAQDFVYWKLAHSYISDVWENQDVGAILKDAVDRAAPSINTANVGNVGVTVKAFVARDESLLSIARRLAEYGGAEFRGDKDKNLHFYAKKAQSSGSSVDATKVVRDTFRVKHSLTGFGNSVLIRGGSRHVQDQANAPASESSYATVNATGTRQKKRVFVSKSRVSKVDIWTDPNNPTSLTGDLLVRVQADNAAGTDPVDEADFAKDLASKTVLKAKLTVDGWTEFLMPDHVAPPGGYVWIIVEGAGSSQRVGLDGSGNLMYKTYFEVPIIVRREDAASVAKYGRTELPPVTDTNILTEEDADLLGDALVTAHKEPVRFGSYEVSDMALTSVGVGTTVSASFPKDGIANATSLIVLEKRHVYDAQRGTYALTHAFADSERALRAGDIVRALVQRIKKVEDAIWDTGIVSLLAQVSETAILSDSVTGTEQNAGTFLVDTAKVGFSTVA